MRSLSLSLLVAGAACAGRGGAATPPSSGHLRVVLQLRGATSDSANFDAPATGWRCGGGRGVLLQGLDRARGVLVWLRGDSLTGEFRPVMPGDTASAQRALVAVRYSRRDVPHGLTIDSGSVRVRRAGGAIHVDITGGGLETTEAHRTALTATFDGVRLEPDTTSCRQGTIP